MQDERVIKPEERLPEVPGTLFLFRSCTGSLEYPGTESAVKECLGILGIDVVMDPDQTCCSGYLLTCSAHKPEVSLAITARNLSIVEKKHLDTYTFCNGCFGYLSELAHTMLRNVDYLNMANSMIADWGYKYEGKTKIFHVQDLWYRMKDALAQKVVRPLNGLRIGPHHGCHYLARQYRILDDGGYPTFHEEIIEALGGKPVFYKERQLCCGYAVGRGFTHKEETVQPQLYKKLKSAKDAGVELITTVCPGCNVAIDREQPNLSKRYGEEFNIPVVDLSQIIALALGVPIPKLGFAANTTSLNGILKKLSLEEGS